MPRENIVKFASLELEKTAKAVEAGEVVHMETGFSAEKVKGANGDTVYRFKITTNQVDRDGDIVEPAGADLRHYKKNPIVLLNHDRYAPVGRAEKMTVAEGDIISDVVFATPGVSADADQTRGLVDDDILRATSIGFAIKEFDWLYSAPGNSEGQEVTGMHITKWELREFSIVSVPANPGAVRVRSAAPTGDKADSDDAPTTATDAPTTATDAPTTVPDARPTSKMNLRRAQVAMLGLGSPAQFDPGSSETVSPDPVKCGHNRLAVARLTLLDL